MQSLVRSLDKRWNAFLPSVYLLQSKLEKLGLVLVDNEVSYTDGEENSHV